jgi:hypothetical protein
MAKLGRHMNPVRFGREKNRLFFVVPTERATTLATEDGLMVKPSYAVKASPPTGWNHVGGASACFSPVREHPTPRAGFSVSPARVV